MQRQLHCLADVAIRAKGEERTAQGFSPGKAHGKRIALKGRPTTRRISRNNVFRKRFDGVSGGKAARTIRREKFRAIK
jgi:hypothetical protein